jgi:hypothetical protein
MNFSKLDGLVVWYPMTEGTGTTVNDYTGTKSGTLTNSPTWEKEKTGQYSIEFTSGDSSYVDVGDTTEASVKSVCFWVKCDDATSEYLVDLNGTANITTDGDDDLSANNFTSPTYYVDGVEDATNISDGVWNFVVITTGTGIDVDNLDIGRVSTNYFDGKIMNLMLFDRVLTANEIKALYKQTYIE